MDYAAQKHIYEAKIDFLRKKYVSDFATFERGIEQAEKEDFAAWDDHIEWKAYRTFLSELLQKLMM